jgi:hypothetical protein
MSKDDKSCDICGTPLNPVVEIRRRDDFPHFEDAVVLDIRSDKYGMLLDEPPTRMVFCSECWNKFAERNPNIPRFMALYSGNIPHILD